MSLRSTVLGEPPERARVVIRGADGGSTTLATLSPPGYRNKNAIYRESVAASPTTWAVTLKTVSLGDDYEVPMRDRGEVVASGPVAGGPSRVLASCARHEDDLTSEIDVAVAGDDVVWASATCRGADGVMLAPAGGGGVMRIAADGSNVHLTPSWLGFEGDEAGHWFIELLDRASGATRTIAVEGTAPDFTLGDTGVNALIAPDDPACSSDDCRWSIMRVAPAGTVVRPGPAEEPDFSDLAAGGGRVLANRPHGNGLEAVDLATGAVSYAGGLGLGIFSTEPLAVDATRAAYMAPRCDGTNEVHVEPTVPSPPARLSFVPCPVRVLAHTLTLRRGHRFARLPILCPRGCDDDWALVYRGRGIGSVTMFGHAGVRRSDQVEVPDQRLLGHARRFTATIRPDTFDGASHPHAKLQAPIRIVVRVRA